MSLWAPWSVLQLALARGPFHIQHEVAGPGFPTTTKWARCCMSHHLATTILPVFSSAGVCRLVLTPMQRLWLLHVPKSPLMGSVQKDLNQPW